MSSVKIQGDASGTGILTIAAPNTNTDRTLTLPDVGGGEFIVSDASGNVGIGTAAPTKPLTVDGGALDFPLLVISSDAQAGIEFSDNTTVTPAGVGGQGDALIFKTSGSESMRIDSSDHLIVGKTTTNRTTNGVEARSSGFGRFTTNGTKACEFVRLTSNGDIVGFYKDDTTVGNIGTASDGDFYIASGVTGGCGIHFQSLNIVPATNTGEAIDNSKDLGGSSFRWNDIYATNGTIQTSDFNEKQDIDVLNDAEQRVAQACKGLLRKFRWKDAVAEKGDDARIHFGIIAQDLKAAFEAEGLDAGRYAMFISSTWTDEETGEERTRMGVRYPELLAFIIAAL